MKGSKAPVSNHRPIENLTRSVFEFVLHFSSILNYFQHGFTEATDLVTFLNIVTPIVCSEGQFDSICFDISSAFDFILRTLLLDKLSVYGLSAGCVNQF